MMKRMALLLLAAALCVLAACSKEEKQETSSETKTEQPAKEKASKNEEKSQEQANQEGPIQLQILKEDQEAGITLENSKIYQQLDQFVKTNPNMGTKDQFTVVIVDTSESKDGKSNLVLLGVNRMSETMRNYSFTFTFGDKHRTYVLKDKEIKVDSKTSGDLQVGHAQPIKVPLTEAEMSQLKKLDQNQAIVKVENIEAERADS